MTSTYPSIHSFTWEESLKIMVGCPTRTYPSIRTKKRAGENYSRYGFTLIPKQKGRNCNYLEKDGTFPSRPCAVWRRGLSRRCTSRQRYAQKFTPLSQWSSSSSAGCFVDCSFVPRKLARERVQPWSESSVELQGDASDSNSSLRFLTLVRFRSLLFVSLKSSEELPCRRL